MNILNESNIVNEEKKAVNADDIRYIKKYVNEKLDITTDPIEKKIDSAFEDFDVAIAQKKAEVEQLLNEMQCYYPYRPLVDEDLDFYYLPSVLYGASDGTRYYFTGFESINGDSRYSNYFSFINPTSIAYIDEKISDFDRRIVLKKDAINVLSEIRIETISATRTYYPEQKRKNGEKIEEITPFVFFKSVTDVKDVNIYTTFCSAWGGCDRYSFDDESVYGFGFAFTEDHDAWETYSSNIGDVANGNHEYIYYNIDGHVGDVYTINTKPYTCVDNVIHYFKLILIDIYGTKIEKDFSIACNYLLSNSHVVE